MMDFTNKNFGAITVVRIFFFLIINVILLNIIFGLIIDSFAELRDESNDRGKDQTTTAQKIKIFPTFCHKRILAISSVIMELDNLRRNKFN